MSIISDLMQFLSHLSGDEELFDCLALLAFFLSHLSGDEDERKAVKAVKKFLSHLSGDEEELYLKKLSYSKVWRVKYLNLPSVFYLIVTN